MAKVIGDTTNLLKGGKPRPSGGHFYKRDKAGRLLVQSKPQPHAPSGPERAWISNFTCLAHFTKAPWSGDFNNATELQDQSGWYWRDVIHASLSGTLLGDPGKRVTTPTARVHRVGVESLVNGTVKVLTPTNLDWDNNFFWDFVTHPTRLVCRNAGVYLLGAQVEFSSTSGGRRAVQVLLNGVTIIVDNTVHASSANLLRITPLTLWAFNTNDYIETAAFANANGVSCELEAFWILAITPEAVL